jgi:hypothetical protein
VHSSVIKEYLGADWSIWVRTCIGIGIWACIWSTAQSSNFKISSSDGIVPQLGEPRSIFGFYLHYRELRTQNATKRFIMALGLHSICFDEYYLDPLIRAANRVIDERLIVHSCYHRTP